MGLWNYAKETSKRAQLDKNVFEAEWIRGCYQLIGPELPAQGSVKPSMTNTTWKYRVMDVLTSVICQTTCGAGGTQKACENACPAVLINQDLQGVRFRQKCSRELSTSKLSVLFIC